MTCYTFEARAAFGVAVWRSRLIVVEKQRLIELIESAQRDVAEAETDLGKLLGEIDVQARAEKTTVSEVVGHAFKKLRAARTLLSDLEVIVSKELD